MEIFDPDGRDPAPDGAVLFLYINFSVRYRNIQGYIAVLMDLPSLTILKTLIGRLIQRASGRSQDNYDPS